MNCKNTINFCNYSNLLLIVVFSVLIYRNRTNSLEHFSAQDGANFKMYVENSAGTKLYLNLDNKTYTDSEAEGSLFNLEPQVIQKRMRMMLIAQHVVVHLIVVMIYIILN